jgi:hypothetical protein
MATILKENPQKRCITCWKQGNCQTQKDNYPCFGCSDWKASTKEAKQIWEDANQIMVFAKEYPNLDDAHRKEIQFYAENILLIIKGLEA